MLSVEAPERVMLWPGNNLLETIAPAGAPTQPGTALDRETFSVTPRWATESGFHSRRQ